MLKKVQLFLGLIIFGMTTTASANWHVITKDQGFKIDVKVERPTNRSGIETYPLTVRLWSKWHNKNGEAFEEPQIAYTLFTITRYLQQAKQSPARNEDGLIALTLAEDSEGDHNDGWTVHLEHTAKDVSDSAKGQSELQQVSALSFVHTCGDLALHIDLQARRIIPHQGQTHQLALSLPLLRLDAGYNRYSGHDFDPVKNNPHQRNNYGKSTKSSIRKPTFKPFERYRNQ